MEAERRGSPSTLPDLDNANVGMQRKTPVVTCCETCRIHENILKRGVLFVFSEILVLSLIHISGGGGSISNGMDLLNTFPKDVELKVYPLSEMEDDEYSVMAAGLGSPLAMKEKGFGPEAISVVKGMMKVAEDAGKKVAYVYSGEQGGFNTMVPIYAALHAGLPLLDLDGNGRAVPELNTGLAPINNIPIDPLVLANSNGDLVVGHPKNPLDSVACETIARSICMAYGMSVGFSTWMMSKADHEKASAIGQISRCLLYTSRCV